MNTVEKIVEICKNRKIAISRLEKACGFSNGYIRGLKRGDMPSNKLAKVADFLGVSTEYLSGEEEPVYYLNPETAKLAQEMFEDKDMRALFDMKRNMKPEVFKAHYDMMKKLYELENPTNETGC